MKTKVIVLVVILVFFVGCGPQNSVLEDEETEKVTTTETEPDPINEAVDEPAVDDTQQEVLIPQEIQEKDITFNVDYSVVNGSGNSIYSVIYTDKNGEKTVKTDIGNSDWSKSVQLKLCNFDYSIVALSAISSDNSYIDGYVSVDGEMLISTKQESSFIIFAPLKDIPAVQEKCPMFYDYVYKFDGDMDADYTDVIYYPGITDQENYGYIVESTKGATSKFHDDADWVWTSGDLNVWNDGDTINPFATWNAHGGVFTHYWIKGSFNLDIGDTLDSVYLKNFNYDPINGNIPLNDSVYVWVNDSDNFIAYGGSLYYYKYKSSYDFFDVFSIYSDSDLKDDPHGRLNMDNLVNGWHIDPLNLDKAEWVEGENTIYLLAEDHSGFGAIGKIQLVGQLTKSGDTFPTEIIIDLAWSKTVDQN